MTSPEAVKEVLGRRCTRTADAIADLTNGTHTAKEIARRLNVKPNAVYEMRRRFERSAKVELTRHETRGRKPVPLN